MPALTQLIGPPQGSLNEFASNPGAALNFLDIFQMHGAVEAAGGDITTKEFVFASPGQTAAEMAATPAGIAEAAMTAIHQSRSQPGRDKDKEKDGDWAVSQAALFTAALAGDTRPPLLSVDLALAAFPPAAEGEIIVADGEASAPADPESVASGETGARPEAPQSGRKGSAAGSQPAALWPVRFPLESPLLFDQGASVCQFQQQGASKPGAVHLETAQWFGARELRTPGDSNDEKLSKAGDALSGELAAAGQLGGAHASGLSTPLRAAAGAAQGRAAGTSGSSAFERKMAVLPASEVVEVIQLAEARGPVSAALRMVDASRHGTHWRRNAALPGAAAPPFVPATGRLDTIAAEGKEPGHSTPPILSATSIWSPRPAMRPVPLPVTAGDAMAASATRTGGAVNEQTGAVWNPGMDEGPETVHGSDSGGVGNTSSSGGMSARESVPGRKPLLPVASTASHASEAAMRPPAALPGPASLAIQAATGRAEPAGESSASRHPQPPEMPMVNHEDPARAGEPLRELRVRLEAEAGRPVDVRFVQSDKDLRVVFRTPDAALSRTLSAAVPELAEAMGQRGWESEAWQGIDPGRRESGTGDDAAGARGKAEDSLDRADHRHGWPGEGGQQRRQNRSRPDWLEEIERGLDGGLNAVAFRAGGD